MTGDPETAEERGQRLARQQLLNARCHGAWVAAETRRLLQEFRETSTAFMPYRKGYPLSRIPADADG